MGPPESSGGRGIVVEVTGRGAAGKSSVAEAVRRELPPSRKMPRTAQVFRALRFVISHPHVLALTILVSWRSSSRWSSLHTTRYVLTDLVRSWSLKRQPGIHVLEHGIFQTLRKTRLIPDGGRPALRVRLFLRVAPMPDLLVVLRVRHRTARERLLVRHHEHGTLPPGPIADPEGWTPVHPLVLAAQGHRPGMQLMILDNDDPRQFRDNVERVLVALRKMVA